MRLTAIRFFSNLSKMVDFYAQFNPSPLSIKHFVDFGKFILFFIYLKKLGDFHI